MSGFDVGEKVQLQSSRGGWVGFVTAVSGAASGRTAHLVTSENPYNPFEGIMLVDELDIQTGGLPIKDFVVGDRVALSGQGGEIVAEEQDGFRVRFDIVRNKHLTTTRYHIVPAWRLALDN